MLYRDILRYSKGKKLKFKHKSVSIKNNVGCILHVAQQTQQGLQLSTVIIENF